MTILHPMTTFLLMLLAVTLLALSVILPPLIFFTPSFILTLRLTAMRTLIHNLLEKQGKSATEDNVEKEITEASDED
jgi:uncharacterized membrane protein YesL